MECIRRTTICSPPKYAYSFIYGHWPADFAGSDRWTHMEQSLADKGEGEELIDTRLGCVHSTDNRLQPSHYTSSLWYGHWPADYALNLNRSMDTHGTKFSDRGDREELIDIKIGGVHSTVNRLKYASSVWYGHCLLNMRRIPKSWMDR